MFCQQNQNLHPKSEDYHRHIPCQTEKKITETHTRHPWPPAPDRECSFKGIRERNSRACLLLYSFCRVGSSSSCRGRVEAYGSLQSTGRGAAGCCTCPPASCRVALRLEVKLGGDSDEAEKGGLGGRRWPLTASLRHPPSGLLSRHAHVRRLTHEPFQSSNNDCDGGTRTTRKPW